ncbi:hypothetical protein CSPX01_04219 [Colletotrichum filicis]|nr:hypothetical protein CSPX01_04219 [Colletotrichum filicis]
MGTPNIQGVDEGLAWSQTQKQKCLTPPVQRQQISKSPERLMNLTVTAIPDGQSPTTSELARGRTDDQLNYVTGGKTSGFFTGTYKWLFRTLDVMGDEREIADITLQLLARAGEITQKEQSTMPSTTLASRVRTGAGASVGQISSKTAPAHSGVGNRQGSYEHRGRHKNIKDAAPETAQDAGDQGLQPSITPTETMKILGPLPVRRAWRVRHGRASPDISQTPVLEAIMLHERGDLQGSQDQCSKCRRGDGISPECVKMPGIYNGACSNCLLARTSDRPGSSSRPVRSYSAERRSISATISPSIPKEDLIAVWNLIAGVIATQPQECFTEDGSEPPGKKIEDAARLVARSADEWGHTIKEEESDPGKTPKTPSERSRLVRQATRIRETALQIANCARIWGEKLERKKSSSQLR